MSIPVLLPTLGARFAGIIGIMFFDRPRGLGNDLPFHRLLPLVHVRLRDQFAALVARARPVYDPEMVALIEAAPQAKRLLRAILLATFTRSSEMPEILRLPPKVRAPCRRALRAAAPAIVTPSPARPVSPRWPYRPSCNWPKGVLTPRPRSRGKLRYGAKPPLPD